jgi:hypothetical protein
MAHLQHCFCDEVTGLEATASSCTHATHVVFRRPDGISVPIERIPEASLHAGYSGWRFVRREYCGTHPSRLRMRAKQKGARAHSSQSTSSAAAVA